MVTPKRPEATCLMPQFLPVPKRSAFFSALAAVGHGAEAVEREGDGLVRLWRERAERHRAAHEVAHDGVDGLDLVDGNRLRGPEGELRAEGHAAFAVDGVGVALEERGVVAPHRLAEVRQALRVPQMLLAVPAQVVFAAGAGRDGTGLGRLLLPSEDERLDVIELESAHGRCYGAEVGLHELRAEADGLEYLGAAVGAQRRDAHLRHDLEEALVHGGDGGGAEAQQQRVVHDLAHFAGLDYYAHRRADAGIDQRPVDCGDGEE